MTIKIVTHADLDGGGCAILLSNVYGKDNVNITSLGYKNIVNYLTSFMENETYKKYQKTFITDISLKEEEFISMFGERVPKGVFFIDHHDTSKHIKGKPNCFWDDQVCGTGLVYELLIKNHKDKIGDGKFADLVNYIEDYDLWRRDFPVSDDLNFLYFRYWSDKFIKRFYDGFDGLTKDEQEYVDKKRAKIRKMQEETEWNLGYDNRLCYAQVPDMHHVVTNYIYEEVSELVGSLVFNTNPKIKVLGIKARPEYLDKRNLSIGEFCERFGGGGHKHVGAIGGDLLRKHSIEKIMEEFAKFLGL